MKIIEKLKERRKRKIEEAFYKAFPEKANYVPPEKQLATMTIERTDVRPAELVVRESIYYPDVANMDPDFEEYIKKEIAIKIIKKALEVGVVDFHTEKKPYLDQYTIIGSLRVLPKRDERGGFYVGN